MEQYSQSAQSSDARADGPVISVAAPVRASLGDHRESQSEESTTSFVRLADGPYSPVTGLRTPSGRPGEVLLDVDTDRRIPGQHDGNLSRHQVVTSKANAAVVTVLAGETINLWRVWR